MLPELPEALTQRCVQELRAIPSLHHALTPLVKPGQDDLNRRFSLALDIAQEAPRAFKGRNNPAALIAAMAVVHDTAYQDRINENIAESGSLRELVPFLLSLPARTTMNGFLQLPPKPWSTWWISPFPPAKANGPSPITALARSYRSVPRSLVRLEPRA